VSARERALHWVTDPKAGSVGGQRHAGTLFDVLGRVWRAIRTEASSPVLRRTGAGRGVPSPVRDSNSTVLGCGVRSRRSKHVRLRAPREILVANEGLSAHLCDVFDDFGQCGAAAKRRDCLSDDVWGSVRGGEGRERLCRDIRANGRPVRSSGRHSQATSARAGL